MTEFDQRACLLRGEELTELPALWLDEDLYGSSIGNDINENDQIAGGSTIEDYLLRAIKWTPDDGMINIGTLPEYELSWGEGINDNGDVIGICGNWRQGEDYDWFGYRRAFLYTADEGMIDLGILPEKTVSYPLGINNQGVIVGYSAYETDEGDLEDMTAFIWMEGEMVPLSDMIGVPDLESAGDINERGQITGTAYSSELDQYAFIWTPEIDVQIDINIIPGSLLNCISNHSLGLIPVSVFGNSSLNVRDIDLGSLRLQELLEIETVSKEGKPLVQFRDQNRDGYEDLTVFFRNQKGVFKAEDTTAILTGNLNDGTSINGTNSICILS